MASLPQAGDSILSYRPQPKSWGRPQRLQVTAMKGPRNLKSEKAPRLRHSSGSPWSSWMSSCTSSSWCHEIVTFDADDLILYHLGIRKAIVNHTWAWKLSKISQAINSTSISLCLCKAWIPTPQSPHPVGWIPKVLPIARTQRAGVLTAMGFVHHHFAPM